MAEDHTPAISYEDLAQIEDDFEAIDTEIMRKQYHLSQPIYAKRAAAVSKIPNFWPLVLEQAPPEIDRFIQPQDSAVFAEALLSVTVSRPEIEPEASTGNPRSLRFRFEFAENEWFEDTVLEKTFWYRRALDGWSGLVSEPVGIRWKKGRDLSKGLVGMAVGLFEARKARGEMGARELKEFEVLKGAMETANPAAESFFTWFGFVGSRRWVGAEESEAATKAHLERRERRRNGEKVEEPTPEEAAAAAKETLDEEEEGGEDDGDVVELNPQGDELAIALADDVWPGALRYFMQAQEMDDEMSEGDFEELEGDISDLEGEGEGEPVDIRALVGQQKGPKSGKGRTASGSGQPPSKKVKK
ncbi:hypothetical protein MBLNU230_g0554t1 [Neophaeotheca triangularis]